MTYLDPKRLAKIDAFQRLVKTRQLEPYYSQLTRQDWSFDQVLKAYHHHYYRSYHQQSKTGRWQNFTQKCKSLLAQDLISASIYILRTVAREGLLFEPDAAGLQRLQTLWDYFITDIGSDDYFQQIDQPLGLLGLYYPQDPEEKLTPKAIKRRQTQLADKLAQHRDQIAQRSLESYSNKPLAPLWQWVMLFDQEEAEHLASLSDFDYYNSDYWREFTQHYQQQKGANCPLCGAQAPLFLHNPHRQYRGQEYFFPKAVTCRCQQSIDP